MDIHTIGGSCVLWATADVPTATTKQSTLGGYCYKVGEKERDSYIERPRVGEARAVIWYKRTMHDLKGRRMAGGQLPPRVMFFKSFSAL